mgnify:CR=1 FL=1
MDKPQVLRALHAGIVEITFTKKDGTKAKKGLYYNINQKKKSGTSNTKKKSTITAKAYKNMKSGFKK